MAEKSYDFSQNIGSEKSKDAALKKKSNKYSFSNPDSIIKPDDLKNFETLLPYLQDSNKYFTLLDYVESDLAKKVVGQEEVCLTMSTAICRHIRNMGFDKRDKKNKILLVGSSGSGKTYIVHKTSNIFDLPFAEVDLPDITTTGYVGANIYDCLNDLVEDAKMKLNDRDIQILKDDPDMDIKFASYGVILMDELDKIAKSQGQTQKDVGGHEVQKQMLRFMDGTYNLKDKRRINTSRMFFAFTGAFSEMKNDSTSTKSSDISLADFDDEENDVNESQLLDNLENYGIDRQLLGRIGHVVVLNEFNRDNIKGILTSNIDADTGKVPFNDLEESLRFVYPNLNFGIDAINLMVNKAYNLKTGGRSVQTVCSIVESKLMMYFRHHRTIYTPETKISVNAKLMQKALDFKP
jgi:ATP-dependent Clp protease ATP-binding subunit ClpX